jgi:hypothetical protein
VNGGRKMKHALEEILNSRDVVTAALARGDSSAQEQLRNLLILIFQSTGVLKRHL